MVGVGRVELPTPAMSTQCSTTELYAHTLIIQQRTIGSHAGSGALAKLAHQCKRFASAIAKNLALKAGLLLVLKRAFNLKHQIAQVKRL